MPYISTNGSVSCSHLTYVILRALSRLRPLFEKDDNGDISLKVGLRMLVMVVLCPQALESDD